MVPLTGFGRAMVFEIAFSPVESPHNPSGLPPVSIYSMRLRVINEKINVFCSRITTSMSLRSLMFLTCALKVISVRFFRSKSSQITTLWRAPASTRTMKLVLYIISISSTLCPKFCLFFLILSLDESFWMISKPCVVETAKYSWL